MSIPPDRVDQGETKMAKKVWLKSLIVFMAAACLFVFIAPASGGITSEVPVHGGAKQS
jgi:hypothetical protein